MLWRVLIAVIAVVAIEIGLTFLIAFFRTPGIHNTLYWSVPPIAVAFVAFRSLRGKLLGTAGLWLLIFPSFFGAEMIAHAVGTCLY